MHIYIYHIPTLPTLSKLQLHLPWKTTNALRTERSDTDFMATLTCWTGIMAHIESTKKDRSGYHESKWNEKRVHIQCPLDKATIDSTMVAETKIWLVSHHRSTQIYSHLGALPSICTIYTSSDSTLDLPWRQSTHASEIQSSAERVEMFTTSMQNSGPSDSSQFESWWDIELHRSGRNISPRESMVSPDDFDTSGLKLTAFKKNSDNDSPDYTCSWCTHIHIAIYILWHRTRYCNSNHIAFTLHQAGLIQVLVHRLNATAEKRCWKQTLSLLGQHFAKLLCDTHPSRKYSGSIRVFIPRLTHPVVQFRKSLSTSITFNEYII